MIDERQEELACLYALGALPPDEAKAFEGELETNAELRQLIGQLREASAGLALSSTPATPPPELRNRILAALPEKQKDARPEKIVRPDFQAPQRSSAGWMSWLPWALAACLAVCSFLVYQKAAKLNKQVADLIIQRDAQVRLLTTMKSEVSAAQREIASAKDELDRLKQADLALRREMRELTEQRDAQVRLLTAATNEIARLEKEDRVSAVRIAMLTSQLESSPKMIAVSLWDPERQSGVIMAQDLATLPVDKDYQLWVLDDKGKPYSAGTLTVDAQGHVRGTFKPTTPVPAAKTFAITVEKKGGENAPTTKPILVGSWL